jgi:Ca2+-binding EF-hand superfamily protein
MGPTDSTNDIWRGLIGEGDANDDGEISFEEFKGMMHKLLNKQNTVKNPNSGGA